MKAKPQAVNAPETLVLKLALRHTDSERVIVLPRSLLVEDLHRIALKVFNFFGEHLSQVIRNNGRKSTVRPDFDRCEEFEGGDDIWSIPLRAFLPMLGSKAFIEYDFGDGWEIFVTRMADKATAAPFTCIKSQGYDAIEDCGGPGGLADIYGDLADWLDASKEERAEFESERLDWAFELASLTEEKARALLAPPSSEEITRRIGNLKLET